MGVSFNKFITFHHDSFQMTAVLSVSKQPTLVKCLKMASFFEKLILGRVLTNSKCGLFYFNFLILTPTFSKVPIEKYGKTPKVFW